jgi:hypothetical protein
VAEELVVYMPLFDNPLGWPEFSPFDDSTWEFHLLASMPQHGLYLYGEGSYATTIHHNGRISNINVRSGVSTRGNVPQILYHDLDGDGINELAMITHAGAGTGVSVSHLHLLTRQPSGDWVLSHSLENFWDDLNNWFKPPMFHEVTEDGDAFYLHFDGEKFLFDITEDYQIYGNFEISYGTHIGFEFEDNQIKVYIAIATVCETFPNPGYVHYFGSVTANVIFDGQSLFLDEYKFERI